MRSRVQREAFQLNRGAVLLLSADNDGEQVLRVRDSKARESSLARRYSGLRNDALPADCKFPMATIKKSKLI